MELVKKLNNIFEKEQKWKLLILFIMILIGTFAELLGVSAVLPLIQVAMKPAVVEENILVSRIADIFHCSTTAELLFVMALGITLIFFVKNVYIIIMYAVQYQFVYNNQKRLAVRLMKTYVRKPYVFHLENNSAELQRNANTDSERFYYVVTLILQFFTDVFLIGVLFLFLLYKDIVMTLISMAFILTFMGGYYQWTKSRVKKLGDGRHDSNAKIIQCLVQTFEGIKEIKVAGRENYFELEYETAYSEYTDTMKKHSIYNVIPKYLLETVAIAGIMMVVMIQAKLGGDMNVLIENLAVFAVAVFKLVPSANRINGSLNAVIYALPSINTVYTDLKEMKTPEVRNEKKNVHTVQEISFEKELRVCNLWYQYPDAKEYVLENVSICIPKGAAVAFVGESGSGKTTLADIILGVLTPDRVTVLTDGIDIFENIPEWQKNIGYIPQNIFLMDDTIRHNIAFGIEDQEINEESLNLAIARAQLSSYINELPDGVNTIVGERGVRMSGGQRQRIGIARALYHDPELLVMDEATSALDQDTEKAVMESIEALYGSKTLIIIAHRLSTIERCDIVYEVRDKQVWKKSQMEKVEETEQ